MNGQNIEYVLPVLCAAIVCNALALYAQRQTVPGARPLVWLMLSATLWSLAYAMELGSTSPDSAAFWANAQYLGSVIAPAAWLILALEYTGQARWSTRRTLALLSVEPLLTLLLALTNRFHGLILAGIAFDATTSLPVETPGAWYWVDLVYSYALVLGGSLLLLRLFRQSPRVNRLQTGVLLAGAVVPWIVDLAVSAGLVRFAGGLDLKPFGFIVTGLAWAWGLFRLQLLDIVPVARGALFESMSDAVLVLDTKDQIADLNASAAQMLNSPPPQAIGKPVAQFRSIAPGLIDRYRTADDVRDEVIIGDGSARRYFDLRIDPLRDRHGKLTGRMIVLHDITARKRAVEALSQLNAQLEDRVAQRTAELTHANEELLREIAERKRAEQALRESETRYALAARGANDGLWDWDITTNHIYYSPRWKAMLGCTENEVGDSPDEWFRRVHREDMPELRSGLMTHLEGAPSHFESELRMLHSDGEFRWMLVRGMAIRDGDGKYSRMAGSLTDITRRKVAEERLVHDALHEPLTGLPNRALFIDRLGQELRSGQRRGVRKSAVLFLDLDRFKVVNDSLGHLIGDHLLVAIGQRLEACVRPGDTVARFGGDEFGILLADIHDDSDAAHTAERVLHGLSTPFTIDGHGLTASGSIGIALVYRAGSTGRLYETAEEILRDADTAMYHAKAEGRARYKIFSASMHARAVALQRTEADLRRAIEQQQFELHYQPIVSVATRRMSSVEALVRWRHPERGFIAPGEFIPVAEETGVIVPLGDWILRTACAQIAAWRSAGYPTLRVAVNFSARQFQDPGLVIHVREALAKAGIAGSALEIEITESTAMSNVELSIRTLNELNAEGVQLSIDDFGTSYSTLSNLRRFPFKILKIDQSFLHDVVHDIGNAAITTAITAMARTLKLRVIAEGVETEDQLAFLRMQQCDEAQGFLFSRPLPAGELTPLLRSVLSGEGPVLWPQAAAVETALPV